MFNKSLKAPPPPLEKALDPGGGGGGGGWVAIIILLLGRFSKFDAKFCLTVEVAPKRVESSLQGAVVGKKQLKYKVTVKLLLKD